MAIEFMADNEVLNDPAAHFFKSGNVVRNNVNNRLTPLRDALHSACPKGVKMEYDLWYDSGDGSIKGYVYTDLMSSCVLIRAANQRYTNSVMVEASHHHITPEADMVWDKIASQSSDKYALLDDAKPKDFVVFLPGTNIAADIVDWKKLNRAVEQGAYVKPHPISAPAVIAKLVNDYGEERVLPKKASGHYYLENASIIGCCTNSEMGLLGLIKEKSVYIFDLPEDNHMRTYTSIYRAIKVGDNFSGERLKRIISAPYSGFVSVFHSDWHGRILSYFNHLKEVPHVASINT